MEITREIATKILTTIDQGLVKGVGRPHPGEMCIEAAICYALGLPHGDDPGCVSQPLRHLKIALNDKAWSSNAARAVGLRRLGLAQLGSVGVLDEKKFMTSVVKMAIGKVVPRALRYAAAANPTHAEALNAAAVLCEKSPTQKSARAAAYAAHTAGAAYAAYAAHAAAHAAAYAADAAAHAAEAAAHAAHAADAVKSAGDTELAFFAEEVVQILITMGAPGCQWLDLAPLPGVLRG